MEILSCDAGPGDHIDAGAARRALYARRLTLAHPFAEDLERGAGRLFALRAGLIAPAAAHLPLHPAGPDPDDQDPDGPAPLTLPQALDEIRWLQRGHDLLRLKGQDAAARALLFDRWAPDFFAAISAGFGAAEERSFYTALLEAFRAASGAAGLDLPCGQNRVLREIYTSAFARLGLRAASPRIGLLAGPGFAENLAQDLAGCDLLHLCGPGAVWRLAGQALPRRRLWSLASLPDPAELIVMAEGDLRLLCPSEGIAAKLAAAQPEDGKARA